MGGTLASSVMETLKKGEPPHRGGAFALWGASAPAPWGREQREQGWRLRMTALRLAGVITQDHESAGAMLG